MDGIYLYIYDYIIYRTTHSPALPEFVESFALGMAPMIFLPGTDLKSLVFTSWLCLFLFQNQQGVLLQAW